MRTTILRDERPFHVVTDARFRAVDRALERVFTEMGVKTSASLVREADRTILRVSLDFTRPLAERETPVSELFDLDHLRFVLTEGRFGAVTGFDVTEGTVATLSHDWLDRAEKACDAKGTIEFTLSWTTIRLLIDSRRFRIYRPEDLRCDDGRELAAEREGSRRVQLRLGMSVQLQCAADDRQVRRGLDVARRGGLLWRHQARWAELLRLRQLARRDPRGQRRGAYPDR